MGMWWDPITKIMYQCELLLHVSRLNPKELVYHKVLYIEQLISGNLKKHRGEKSLCFYFAVYNSNPVTASCSTVSIKYIAFPVIFPKQKEVAHFQATSFSFLFYQSIINDKKKRHYLSTHNSLRYQRKSLLQSVVSTLERIVFHPLSCCQ